MGHYGLYVYAHQDYGAAGGTCGGLAGRPFDRWRLDVGAPAGGIEAVRDNHCFHVS